MTSLEGESLSRKFYDKKVFLTIHAYVHELEDLLGKEIYIIVTSHVPVPQATSMLPEPLLSSHCSMILLDSLPPHPKLPHSTLPHSNLIVVPVECVESKVNFPPYSKILNFYDRAMKTVDCPSNFMILRFSFHSSTYT